MTFYNDNVHVQYVKSVETVESPSIEDLIAWVDEDT